jgi:glycosyltransferase involved in cell wall biosynthesis
MRGKKLSITVIIPTLNEESNLSNCLKPILNWVEKIIIVDSNSTDGTLEIAKDSGVEILNFSYKGGWPKKRQYVLDTYNFKTDWILLLDADEILTEKVKESICNAINSDQFDGYYLWFKMYFLNKFLRFSDPGMRKLSLFRAGFGAYEMRYENQNSSMGDMEVHEHVIVKGRTGEIKEPIQHFNYNSLSRFIIKHDQYSNYECKVHIHGSEGELNSRFFGSFEQRRRYIKGKLIRNPLAPIFYFLYMFIFRFGFIDGRQGFYYILYQSMYLYFVNSKIYEQENINTPQY